MNMKCVVLIAACVGIGPASLAQTTNHDFEEFPSQHGQWAGPWDLSGAMGIVPLAEDLYHPKLLEITHLFVLPPDHPSKAGSSLYEGKVMFVNDRDTPYTQPLSEWDQNDQPTFVWDVASPMSRLRPSWSATRRPTTCSARGMPSPETATC